jgi:hypothetical protein
MLKTSKLMPTEPQASEIFNQNPDLSKDDSEETNN